MGDAYDPEADETLAELVHASIARGLVLSAHLQSDSEVIEDPRIRAFYVREAAFIGAIANMGDHLTKRQLMDRMTLTFALNAMGGFSKRVHDLEMKVAQLRAPVSRWQRFKRLFGGTKTEPNPETLKLKSQLREAQTALMIVEGRLSVMAKWETQAIAAPSGVMPHSKRLEAITVALNEVSAARGDCETSEEAG